MKLTKYENTRSAFSKRVPDTMHGYQIVTEYANTNLLWHERPRSVDLMLVLTVLTSAALFTTKAPFLFGVAIMTLLIFGTCLSLGFLYKDYVNPYGRFCTGDDLRAMESRLNPDDLKEWRVFERINTAIGEPITVSHLFEFSEKLKSESRKRHALMKQNMNRVKREV